MIKPEVKNKIDWVFERYYDDIADELDTIARRNDLTSTETIEYIRNWDFEEYYEEWIEEGN